MDDPPKEYEPQGEREHELNDGHAKAALKKLPESGNEEAAQRCQYIPTRSLSGHFSPPRRCAGICRLARKSIFLNCTDFGLCIESIQDPIMRCRQAIGFRGSGWMDLDRPAGGAGSVRM